MTASVEVSDGPAARGFAALAQRSWAEARSLLAAALEVDETAATLEGYARACWWLDDVEGAIEARSRAYALFARAGDRRGAARMATALAGDFGSFKRQQAVAEGCLRRARRLLDGLAPTPEHAWLTVREAEIALFLRHDNALGRELLAQAIELSSASGVPDVELVALALLGLSHVTDGRVSEGLELLDEAAAAISVGELSELEWIGLAYCCFIYAFEDVREYDRAGQWCGRLFEFFDRVGIRSGTALCRAHEAGVRLSRGAWDEAETELEAAAFDLSATRPPHAAEAFVRLAELRLRQGRTEEAASLFAQAEPHPAATRGRAAVLHARGQHGEAISLLTAALDGLAGHGERASTLELLIEAEIATGQVPDARVAELELVATAGGTPSLTASARFAAGIAAAAAVDHEGAIRWLQEAVGLSLVAGTPFETARARFALAASLAALGRDTAAREEAQRSLQVFETLGAAGEYERAAGLLRRLEPRRAPRNLLGLSRRELDVVELLAVGCSNREIAARLVVSEHTVRRHVANILRKLQVRSRTAAVARAVEARVVSYD